MSANKMIVIGEKESFIVRVLIQKAQGAGCETEFARLSVDDINAKIKDVSLITLYLDDDTIPQEDVLHYLTDIMDEQNLQMILIGEQIDIEQIRKHLPEELIYETFCRPVDNEKFARTVADYFAKVASGEFKKSILIVDDDPQYLTLVREWLKGTYKVSMANSGLRAIKWLGKNKVDLILLDHEMPVTSGPQVLEMLRSDPETRNIPVMFLTGKGDKDSVMKVVALKPEGYFLKNIGREELIDKLQEFFILHR
jgi:CheY-like chemotaxis protein